jgi:hypothetical protein
MKISIVEVAAGLDLTILAESSSGRIHRALEVANCTELAEAAALVLSVWLSERTVPATLQTTRDDDAAPLPSAAAPADAPSLNVVNRLVAERPRVSRVAFRPAPLRHRARVELGAALAFGILPEQAQGAFVGLTAEALTLVWSLRCLYLQNLTHIAERSPRQLGGRYGLTAAEVHLGRWFPITAGFGVEAFAWSMLGRLRAEGVGPDESAVNSGDFGASGFGMATDVHRGRLRLGVEGSLGLPWARPRYLIDETVVFRPPPLLGLLGIRAGFAFL